MRWNSLTAHAGMQQRARLKALDRFKSNENAVLVASDVAARGLDITVWSTLLWCTEKTALSWCCLIQIDIAVT